MSVFEKMVSLPDYYPTMEQDGYELCDAICGLEITPMAQRQSQEETEYYQYNQRV